MLVFEEFGQKRVVLRQPHVGPSRLSSRRVYFDSVAADITILVCAIAFELYLWTTLAWAFDTKVYFTIFVVMMTYRQFFSGPLRMTMDADLHELQLSRDRRWGKPIIWKCSLSEIVEFSVKEYDQRNEGEFVRRAARVDVPTQRGIVRESRYLLDDYPVQHVHDVVRKMTAWLDSKRPTA